MDYVYFVQERASSGSHRDLIKICATGDCPYIRLNQLRRALPKSRLELLGSISIPLTQDTYGQSVKHEIERQFECLRDKGDWFRVGIQLVSYIREHARPHICDTLCPNGTSIEEEIRALGEVSAAAIARAWKNVNLTDSKSDE